MRAAGLLAALALAGCASLKAAITPAALNDDADAAYITVATLNPANIWAAWNALQAERAAYVALSHVTAPTALDIQADALRPIGAPPPVFLLVPEGPLTQAQATAKLKAMARKAKGG